MSNDSDQKSNAAGRRFSRRAHGSPVLIAAVLAMLTILLYWPAIRFGFVNYDDPDYVTANPRILGGLSWANAGWALTTGAAANWHPLTWLSLMLDVTLFGKSAAGMHGTNLVLHTANVVLLFGLLRRLTGATWRSASVAALFAWHPAHVESVAWISERKDVLSTFFGWLTLLAYARYALDNPLDRREKAMDRPETGIRTSVFMVVLPSAGYYWLAWSCLVLGLMSKSMLVTWPFLMLLLDYWPLRRWPTHRATALIAEKTPFFFLAFTAALVTFFVQKQEGAMMAVKGLPMGDRFANALISYVLYLKELLWPENLAIFYPHPGHWLLPWVGLAGLFLASISLVAWRWRARQPAFLVGWLWYLGTLVPVIGLVQVGSQARADRYSYIPSVGLFMMAAWGGYAIFRRVGRVGNSGRSFRPPAEAAVRIGGANMDPSGLPESTVADEFSWGSGAAWFLAIGGVAIAIACFGGTRQQLAYWRDSESLFRHALAVTQGNYIAHYNLGFALDAEGKTNEAIGHYQQAVNLRPDVADFHSSLAVDLSNEGQTDAAIEQYQEALRWQPDDAPTHHNLGLALVAKGQIASAIRQFQEALRLKPDFAMAHYDLGVTFNKQGNVDGAIGQFQTALNLDPVRSETHYNLGNALAAQGQIDKAIQQYQETIRLKPDNVQAHNNLGNLLAREGKTDDATSEFAEALRLDPEDASTHYNFGNLLLQTGQPAAALTHFQAALKQKAGFAPLHYNLGVALSKTGQTASAISQFQEAIRLQPDYAIAHNSLGIALATLGRTDKAIIQFQEALRIKPDYASAQNNLAKALASKNK